MDLVSRDKFIDMICSAVAIILATAFGSFLFFSPSLPAEASPENHLAQIEILNKVAEDSGLVLAGSAQADKPLSEFLGKIISPVLGIVGSLFFVLIVIAGIMWLTAAGNEEKVGKAKKILSTAFIGLLLVIMAYTITRFVISNILEATKDPEATRTACFTIAVPPNTGNCTLDPRFDCQDNMLSSDCINDGGVAAENSLQCSELCESN